MTIGEAVLLALPIIGACVTFVALTEGVRLFAVLRRVFVGCVLPLLGIGIVVAGSLYGLLLWATTYRPLHEEHIVDEYRVEFTSEQSPKLENPDSALVRVYRHDELVAGPVLIGFTRTKSDGLFTVRRLPNDSLIIVCPRHSERNVVFVYDIATGEKWPGHGPDFTIEEQARESEYGKRLEARIRAGLGDNRYDLSTLWPSCCTP